MLFLPRDAALVAVVKFVFAVRVHSKIYMECSVQCSENVLQWRERNAALLVVVSIVFAFGAALLEHGCPPKRGSPMDIKTARMRGWWLS